MHMDIVTRSGGWGKSMLRGGRQVRGRSWHVRMAEFTTRRVAVFVRLLMIGGRRIDGHFMVMKYTGGDRRLSVIK